MAINSNNFSVWCDFVERNFIQNGLHELIDSGVVSGVTSNPVIFRNAILNSDAYEASKQKTENMSPIERYEEIVIEDIRNAARLLLPVYQANKNDGFVSIEVNPLLANDSKKMTEEAKRIYKAIDMPNVMIKVPATPNGYETIKDLIIENININATLVFSPMQAGKCLQAIENGFFIFQRRNPGKPFPQAVISVFVSRFDRKLDPFFEQNGLEKMKFGIMNASYVYQIIKEHKIPNVRCLFASTGVSGNDTKNAYYIKKLLYSNAINTAPLNAIEGFMESLDFDERACPSKTDIQKYFDEVSAKGVVLRDVYDSLLEDGLEQFNLAFQEMLIALGGKKSEIKETKETKKEQKEEIKKEDEKPQSSELAEKQSEKSAKDVKKEETKTKEDNKIAKPQVEEKKSAQSAPKPIVTLAENNDLDDTPAMSFLKTCLKNLVDYKGSDLHIKSGGSVKGRVNGEIITVDNGMLTKMDMEILAEELLDERYEEFDKKKNIDFIYKLDDEYRFRVNMFHQTDGISAVFRVIPLKLPTIEGMELPDVIKDFTEKRRGLILVTGPTGCGKSTTLATIINLINQTSQRHIITIEDPIEFLYQDQESIINQRSVGQDAVSFSDALRASLREDPDVIMVGEMRDLDTIRTAIRAAETGHLVFSTLHTLDAKETVARIISMFDGNEQNQIRQMLSSVLEAIVSQRLVRRKGGKGRVAAVEVLVKNARIEALIAQGRESEIKDAIEQDRDVYKSQSFNQSLFDLYAHDVINYHEALHAATSPADLKILLDNYNIKKSKNEDSKKDSKVYIDPEEEASSRNVVIDMDDDDILSLK